MGRESLAQTLRPERPSFSYAESDGSTSPGADSPSSSFSFKDSPLSTSSKASSRAHGGVGSDGDGFQEDEDDVDELGSDDVIHGKPHQSS